MRTLSNRTVSISSVLTGAAVSWLAWQFRTALIPLSVLFPALAMNQRHRTGTAAVALAYYGVASFPVTQVSSGYFGHGDVRVGVLLWAIASAILAMPWIAFWHRDRDQLAWRLPTALLVGTVPPISIIGWASPLASAGFLFPGCGWFGVLMLVLTCVAIGIRSWNVAVAVAVVSVITNLSYEGPRPPKSAWVGVNTEFGSIQASDDPIIESAVAEQIQRMALDVHGRVIVFPELVVRRWTEATEIFWQSTLDKLRTRGSTIVIGTGSPSAASQDEYRNAVVIRGADDSLRFEQRVPVPVAMWKPWGGKDRVPLNLFGPPTTELADERAAILICYEQLLPWSYMSAFLHRPTLVVGLSNATWTKATVVPRNQSATLQAWGRLFGVSVVSATNY
jgi:hypothetical protein